MTPIQAPPSCPLFWGSIWKPVPIPSVASNIDVKEVFGQKVVRTTLYENNKTVVWKSSFDITVSCSMSFTAFPFDKQRCNLEMRLSGYITPKLVGFNFRGTLNDTLGYTLKV